METDPYPHELGVLIVHLRGIQNSICTLLHLEFILLLLWKPTGFGHCYFGQLFYAHQVYKRAEAKMAIINDRMDNKMALIHNYLFRHPSPFSLCTQEMVVNR